MNAPLIRIHTVYITAQRHFHACLKSYSQCKRNCRFGGRWPKMVRDAKRRYHQAAKDLRAAQVRYYEAKQQAKAA